MPPVISLSESEMKMSDTPRGRLTVRTLTMPADANPNGDIFGGWVVGHMDQAGGIAGVERAKGRVITVAIDAMTFIKPIRVGDVLEVYTEIENVGRTSIKIHIEAWAQRVQTYEDDKVTDATFTFVTSARMAARVRCPLWSKILACPLAERKGSASAPLFDWLLRADNGAPKNEAQWLCLVASCCALIKINRSLI